MNIKSRLDQLEKKEMSGMVVFDVYWLCPDGVEPDHITEDGKRWFKPPTRNYKEHQENEY